MEWLSVRSRSLVYTRLLLYINKNGVSSFMLRESGGGGGSVVAAEEEEGVEGEEGDDADMGHICADDGE